MRSEQDPEAEGRGPLSPWRGSQITDIEIVILILLSPFA